MAIQFGTHPTTALPVQGGRIITKKYLCAFTLAEVLITLVIIGVIAAITVPTLITKYQKEQTVTRLKKVYSAINQCLQRALIDNPNPKSWTIVNSSSSIDSSLEFQEKYLQGLNTIKTIKGSEGQDNEFKNYNTVSLNGSSLSLSGSNILHIFLNDGSIIHLRLGSRTNDNIFATDFIIDINGLQKPNKVGRDIFWFSYGSGNSIITPYGYQQSLHTTYERSALLDDSNAGNCNKLKSGNRCSSIIIIDGWQIKDDYPW